MTTVHVVDTSYYDRLRLVIGRSESWVISHPSDGGKYWLEIRGKSSQDAPKCDLAVFFGWIRGQVRIDDTEWKGARVLDMSDVPGDGLKVDDVDASLSKSLTGW